MMKLRSYNDPLSPSVTPHIRDQWIGDDAFSEVVRKMPIPCVDTVFIKPDDQAIYLGRRTALPMRGIWCFGGRIFFNDADMNSAISRIMEMETGLRISPERFEYLCTHFYSWIIIAQGSFPGKNLAATYSCQVTEEELEQMQAGLKQTEYDREFGIQRFDRNRLVDEKVHPALIDMYMDLFPN